MKLCAICQQAPAVGEKPSRMSQAKAKYCATCRAERRTRPKHTLTPEQGAEVLRLAGTIPKVELCQRLGISWCNVSRFLREQGVKPGHYNQHKPDTIAAVVAVYEAAPPGQGKQRIREQFPDLTSAGRAIWERYGRTQPRQLRWTPDQLCDALRMAGLVSWRAQARYFARPNAQAGSLHKLWNSRLREASGDVNGLPAQLAWQLATPGVPATLVCHANSRGQDGIKILWLDLVPWLKSDVDSEIREAIQVLAVFQGWLHATGESGVIRTFIAERERYADDRDAHDHERPSGARATGSR